MSSPRETRQAAPLTDNVQAYTYSAVHTTVYEAQFGENAGKLFALVTDGNGRQSLVEGIDSSLGMTGRHMQALVAHLGDQARHASSYVAGYNGDQSMTWVLS